VHLTHSKRKAQIELLLRDSLTELA
jgi:hypothetical protein